MSIHTSLVFIGPGYSKDLKAQPANISRTNETWEARNRKQPMLFYIQGALVRRPIGPANNDQ